MSPLSSPRNEYLATLSPPCSLQLAPDFSFLKKINLMISLAASGPRRSTQGFPVAHRLSVCGCGVRVQWLWHSGSLVVVHGLQSAGSVVAVPGLCCPVASGILIPQPGIKPVSPALEGRFLTTGPPGKFLIPYPLQHRIIQNFEYSKSLLLSHIPRPTVD